MKAFFKVAAAVAIAVSASANAEIVMPTNSGGWQPANVRADAFMGITSTYKPAGQNGSLEFTTNTVIGGQDKADFVNYWGVVIGRTLGNVTSASYDWLRDSASTTDSQFVPAYRVAYQTADGKTEYLIYENFYNAATAAAPVNQFVSADIKGANFWMRAFGPGRTIEQYNVTLAGWAAGYTSGTSQPLNANTSIVGIEVGVGSGWGGTFRGAVDNVKLAFGNDLISANFEPNALTPAVPEPATWAMMLVGFGMVAGAARYRRRSTGTSFA